MTGTQPSNGLRISYTFHSDHELYIYEYASLCVVYAHPGVHVSTVYLFDRSLVLRLLGYAYKLCAFLGPISAYRLWKMQYDVAQSNNI